MTVERCSALECPVNGERVTVPSVPHLACPKCGEGMLRFDDARHLQDGAHAIYRERHHLLSPEDIRAIREPLGIAPTELGRLVRVPAEAVSRWEQGRNVPTKQVDLLLRMIRDVPGSLEYLRKQAA